MFQQKEDQEILYQEIHKPGLWLVILFIVFAPLIAVFQIITFHQTIQSFFDFRNEYIYFYLPMVTYLSGLLFSYRVDVYSDKFIFRFLYPAKFFYMVLRFSDIESIHPKTFEEKNERKVFFYVHTRWRKNYAWITLLSKQSKEKVLKVMEDYLSRNNKPAKTYRNFIPLGLRVYLAFVVIVLSYQLIYWFVRFFFKV